MLQNHMFIIYCKHEKYNTFSQNYIRFPVNGRPLVEHSLEDVGKIKKKLDANGVRISSIGSPIGKIMITEDFAAHFALYQKTVEIAKILETPYIRIFSFFTPKGEKPEIYREEVFRRMKKMVEYAEKKNVVLLHENEKDIYGDVAVRCAELMEKFYGEHFKAVFDFANFVQCGQDTIEAYGKLKKYVACIHIKDAEEKSGVVVPAGYGDGKVKPILEDLLRSGYTGFLSLEPHLSDFTGFSDLEQGAEKAKNGLTGEEAYTTAYRALEKILESIDEE